MGTPKSVQDLRLKACIDNEYEVLMLELILSPCLSKREDRFPIPTSSEASFNATEIPKWAHGLFFMWRMLVLDLPNSTYREDGDII